eukprot:14927666-Alexandrium_andersonii.AAC.1
MPDGSGDCDRAWMSARCAACGASARVAHPMRCLSPGGAPLLVVRAGAYAVGRSSLRGRRSMGSQLRWGPFDQSARGCGGRQKPLADARSNAQRGR